MANAELELAKSIKTWLSNDLLPLHLCLHVVVGGGLENTIYTERYKKISQMLSITLNLKSWEALQSILA